MKTKVKWLLPWAIVLLFAPFTPTLDLYFSHLFYSETTASFYNPLAFRILFDYGELFGFFVGGVSLLCVALSFLKGQPFFKRYRHYFLAFLITLTLGAGLITNVLFKGYWGRPRPKQTIEFQGKHHYRPFYHPDFNPKEPQKSFPSGHVAMGICFVSFCLSARRYGHRSVFYASVALTTLLGGGLMAARVAQGGHFFSDVIFSVALIWLVALCTDKWLHRKREGTRWVTP